MSKEEEKVYKTFQEVAGSAHFDTKTSTRYVEYMTSRWRNDEAEMCQTGYALEWADRFRKGAEYGASDIWGQRLLVKIDKLDKPSALAMLLEVSPDKVRPSHYHPDIYADPEDREYRILTYNYEDLHHNCNEVDQAFSTTRGDLIGIIGDYHIYKLTH